MGYYYIFNFFGFRYGVGTDCISYIENYESAFKGYINERHEIGFTYLQSIFVKNNMPSFVFMGFLSFLQLFLVFYSFKDKKVLFPFLSITFFLACIWLIYANGLRQILASCFFVLSLKYVEQKKLKISFVLIALGTLIHASMLLLFPVLALIILDRSWTPSIWGQYTLLLLAIILGQTSFINFIMEYVDKYSHFLGYDRYMDDKYAYMLQRENLHYGIGFFINILISVVLIYNSDKLKSEMRSMIKFYNLYFVGLLIRYTFFANSLIQRVNCYFYGFDYIIGAAILYLLWINHEKKGYYILLSCYILVFGATLYRMFENDSAFYFIWQKESYMEYTAKILPLI